jgi:hypothetical protein
MIKTMLHHSRRSFLKASLSTLAAAGMLQAAETPVPTPPVPKIAGPFINIYRPGPDVYSLPTVTTAPKDGAITYKQGETYPDWRTNDHTFIKDGNKRWHCFGITRPWIPGDNGHAGEGLCFHAMAPEGTFAQTVTFQSWRDLPKINVGDCGWAPTAIKIGGEYSLIGSQLGRATSTDLLTWKDKGRLKIKGHGRDSSVFFWNDFYHLIRCAGNGISMVTSPDFVTWSEPLVIYQPKVSTYQTESPFIMHREGWFYLFWTLWDKADPSTSGYCPRTYVHVSKNPLDFRDKPELTEFTIHAPELIQDESGQWFISSVDHPHRGISVAPLEWK